MEFFKEGDIIEFPRRCYTHYGIYIGSGKVIHMSGPPDRKFTDPWLISSNDKAEVREDDLLEVAKRSRKIKVCNFMDEKLQPFSPEEIVQRAKRELGEKDYNICASNCEHFVTLCRYGKPISRQVRYFYKLSKCCLPQPAC